MTGPESSGKSTLVRELATATGAAHSVEFAREYLTVRSGRYTRSDLTAIAAGQLRLNARAVHATPTDLALWDTGLEVILIWSWYQYGRIDPRLWQWWHDSRADYYLLTYPDLPWSPDPLRSMPDVADRIALFGAYRSFLEGSGCAYGVVGGVGMERLECAMSYVGFNFPQS